MEVGGQHHALNTLTPGGKSLRHPLDSSLGGPQSRSGRRGIEKNLLPSAGTRTPGVYPVVIPTVQQTKKCPVTTCKRDAHVVLGTAQISINYRPTNSGNRTAGGSGYIAVT
jgi:hypothetical protein